MWRTRWASWGELVREKIGEWKMEPTSKKKEGEMPSVFKKTGQWVNENCEVWLDKGVHLLGLDADVFGNVRLAQCWRKSDDVTIRPSCEAIEKFENLYKWMTRGSSSKEEKKLREMLDVAKIDRSIKGDFCNKASGEDVYVALSYIVYLFLGSISERLFRQRQ